jgi:hypothetical protein
MEYLQRRKHAAELALTMFGKRPIQTQLLRNKNYKKSG